MPRHRCARRKFTGSLQEPPELQFEPAGPYTQLLVNGHHRSDGPERVLACDRPQPKTSQVPPVLTLMIFSLTSSCSLFGADTDVPWIKKQASEGTSRREPLGTGGNTMSSQADKEELAAQCWWKYNCRTTSTRPARSSTTERQPAFSLAPD